MGHGKGVSDGEIRRRRSEYKKRWREKNRDRWRVMRTAQKRRYRDRCRVPGRLRRGEWSEMSPEERAAHQRGKWLRAEYGLTVEQYAAMVEDQGGVCAICGKVEEGKRLVVDHCHDSGRVRGLLCNWCNSALGLMRDSQRNLLRAVQYIQKNDRDPWEADVCAA